MYDPCNLYTSAYTPLLPSQHVPIIIEQSLDVKPQKITQELTSSNIITVNGLLKS